MPSQPIPTRASFAPGRPGLSPAAEARLIEQLERGDLAALKWVYDAYAADVYRLARRLAEEATAEEIVAQTFLDLWRQPTACQPRQGGLRAWLLARAYTRAAALEGCGPSPRRGTVRDQPVALTCGGWVA